MNLIKTRGLVLKSISYGEYDKILTVLTQEAGKISVVVKGGKSINHGKSSQTLLFSYGDYILYDKGGMYILSSAEVIESFYDLTKDLDKLNLASEILNFINFTCDESEDLSDLLRVTLNTLYALVHYDKSLAMVKAVFYTKMCECLGIAPALGMCMECGDVQVEKFSPSFGGTLCADCASECPDAVSVSPQTAQVMEYILSCDIKKMFSFKAAEEDFTNVYTLIKEFIKIHLDYEI